MRRPGRCWAFWPATAGRLREAIVFLEEGLHAVGPEPKLYFHLGQTYAAAGDRDAAIRSHRLSLTVNEASPKGHLALGQLLLARGERHAAIEHFGRAVELDSRFDRRPLQPGGGAGRGRSDGGRRKGLSRTARAGARRTRPPQSTWQRLVEQQGRLDEAIEGYRRALAADPRSWKAEFNLGSALAAKRDFAAAAVAFQRAVDLQPDVLDAHVRLGEVLAGCGQAERAQECFRRALAAAPDRLLAALRIECIGERIFARQRRDRCLSPPSGRSADGLGRRIRRPADGKCRWPKCRSPAASRRRR